MEVVDAGLPDVEFWGWDPFDGPVAQLHRPAVFGESVVAAAPVPTIALRRETFLVQ